MKKILLTGASGFIGFNTLISLVDKNHVTIILRKKNKQIINLKKKKRIKIIYFKNFVGLNKSLKKIKVDYIIHCATHYIKKHTYADIMQMNFSNILFGNIILENLKFLKAKKFINLTTVWENYNGIKGNSNNLYSVYKQSFTNIIRYYQKSYKKVSFYNLYLSETFGNNDKRIKIIKVLKDNFKKNKTTKINSKNLIINLLNVKDVIFALNKLINKNIKKGDYIIKNNFNLKISNLINYINKISDRKIKIHYQSNKKISEKFYKFNLLTNFRPKYSKLIDIANFILK
tara:strand:+ start:152 stop:1012 length:861 start_codon:yes stop_codon:yes gene_type:complete